MPILQIWLCWGPTPHPRVVNVVQLRSEMIKQDLNIVFYFFWGGGEGEYLKLPMLSRALSWYVLDMEIFVQNCGYLIPYFYMLLTKVNIEKNL